MLNPNLDKYQKYIDNFAKLDLSLKDFKDPLDGKADWNAIAEAIGSTDHALISYLKTLDNGNGTINNTNASIEGMAAYLKKTGQAFDFAAVKTALFNDGITHIIDRCIYLGVPFSEKLKVPPPIPLMERKLNILQAGKLVKQ